MIQPADLLTADELCERLKMPKSWVYNKLRDQRLTGRNPIPYIKMGKYLRFDWAEVNAWLEKQRKAGI